MRIRNSDWIHLCPIRAVPLRNDKKKLFEKIEIKGIGCVGIACIVIEINCSGVQQINFHEFHFG